MSATDTLFQITSEVSVCTRCTLHKTRNKSVPGVGPENAEIMLIGEGPGYNENEQGLPFVGQAGQFLTELLAQVLPEQSYALQYKFKGGETVDAVIKLSLGLAPIDAKFPLENFKRSVDAADELERAAAGKQFVRDVKKHIDDIAKKYIRTEIMLYLHTFFWSKKMF